MSKEKREYIKNSKKELTALYNNDAYHKEWEKRRPIKGSTYDEDLKGSGEDEYLDYIKEDGLRIRRLPNGNLDVSICLTDLGYYANRIPSISNNLIEKGEIYLHTDLSGNDLHFELKDPKLSMAIVFQINSDNFHEKLKFEQVLFENTHEFSYEQANKIISRNKSFLGEKIKRCLEAADKVFKVPPRENLLPIDHFIETMMVFTKVQFAKFAIENELDDIIIFHKVDREGRHKLCLTPEIDTKFGVPLADFNKPANNIVAFFNHMVMDAFLSKNQERLDYLKSVREGIVQRYEEQVISKNLSNEEQRQLIKGIIRVEDPQMIQEEIFHDSNITYGFEHSSILRLASSIQNKYKTINDLDHDKFNELIAGVEISPRDLVSCVLVINNKNQNDKLAKEIAFRVLEQNQHEETKLNPCAIVKKISSLYPGVFSHLKEQTSYVFNQQGNMEIKKNFSLVTNKNNMLILPQGSYDESNAALQFLKDISVRNINIIPPVKSENIIIGNEARESFLANDSFNKLGERKDKIIKKYINLHNEIKELSNLAVNSKGELIQLDPSVEASRPQKEVLMFLCKKYGWELEFESAANHGKTVSASIKGDLFGNGAKCSLLPRNGDEKLTPHVPLLRYIHTLAKVINEQGKMVPGTLVKESRKNNILNTASKFVQRLLLKTTGSSIPSEADISL